MKQPSHSATQLVSHAFALGQSLGIRERDIAIAALAIAIHVAERNGDPDRYLGRLIEAAMKGKTNGN